MDPTVWLLLLGAGLLAGAMNALAGGGSFFTLPALVLAGVPALDANASSTVALLPGALASVWAWREDLRPIEGVSLRALLLTSLVGGLLGSLLLLLTPRAAFEAVLPWLLLWATVMFAVGRRLGEALRRVTEGESPGAATPAGRARGRPRPLRRGCGRRAWRARGPRGSSRWPR